MKFPYLVTARLEDKWNSETVQYEKVPEIRLRDWATDSAIEHYKNEGHTILVRGEIDIDLPKFTHDQLVISLVEGLRAQKASAQADLQIKLTDIDRQIASLLQLEYIPAESKGEFATNRKVDAQDVEPFNPDDNTREF